MGMSGGSENSEDATLARPDMQHAAYRKVARPASIRIHARAGALRFQQAPRGIVTRLDDCSMPFVIDADETLCERRELRASVLGAAPRDLEDGCAEDALHLPDAVNAGAIAHVGRVARATNRARDSHRLEQPDVTRPNEELAVEGEPPLEPRLDATIEEPRRRAGRWGALRLSRARR